MRPRTPVLPAALAAGFALGILLAGSAPRPARADDAGTAEDPAERIERIRTLLQEAGDSETEPSVLADVDPRLATASELKAIRTIRTKRISISIEDQPLEDTLKILREITGLGFVMSAKAREAAKAEKPVVTLTLENLPIENVLNLISLHLKSYRFTLRYGAVALIRPEERRPRKVLRMYDVSDLVRAPRDFPAPRLGLGKAVEDAP